MEPGVSTIIILLPQNLRNITKMRQWRLEEILGERVRERESETSLLTKAR